MRQFWWAWFGNAITGGESGERRWGFVRRRYWRSSRTMVTTIEVQQRRIDRMQRQIADLTERTDATVEFVQRILNEHEGQQRLARSNQRLAAIPDPMGEIQARVDQTAFTMLYQADLLYKQLNLKDSAAEAYQRVIELFPDNRWAETAKQRLKDMEEQPKSNTKGDVS